MAAMAAGWWVCRRHTGDTVATWPTFVRVCRIFRGVRLSLLQAGFPIPCTYTVSRKMSLYAESHMASWQPRPSLPPLPARQTDKINGGFSAWQPGKRGNLEAWPVGP